jgi:hypothetical protein
LTIHLSPEQERVVGQAIQAGVIRAADDVVSVGLETIKQRLQAQVASKAVPAADEWQREFEAWTEGHSTDTPLLSDEAISRDSIYGTRGL